MEKISVEQSIYGQTYRPAADAQGKKQTNLGGYAFSFEDLLQRVGARLDKAFSAADQSHGLVSNATDNVPDAPARDDAPRRDAADTRDDRQQPRDTGRNDTAADAGPRNDAGAYDNDAGNVESRDNGQPERADNDGKDNHAARDGKDGGTDKSDAATSDNNGDTAQAGGNGDGKKDGQSQSGSQNQTTGGGADANVTQHAAVNQAAAVYAAGIIGSAASSNAKTGSAEQGQQAGKVTEAVQGMVGQIATQANGKAAKGGKTNTHQSTTGRDNAAANAAAQAAQNAAAGKGNEALQNQAQKLAQVMGGDTRAEVKVTIADEAAKLTSKPTQTIANASILTKDDGSQPNSGQQQAGTGQQQGNNGQTAAQAQAAMMQQAQAAQQTAAQPGGAQAQSAGNGLNATGGAGTGLQASGAATHGTGGADALNNTQTPGGAQQSQQTAQTKDAAPTQHAQHAQRELPGNSVADQISVKITKALQAGTDKISIQLKPAELGRVDVKLEMTHDGRVMTVVTAEKQETLDLLRRDASELQKALADAGLQSGDMEFNLKGQEQKTAEDGKGNDNGKEPLADADSEQDEPEGAVLTAWESGILMNGRLDMRA